MISPMSSRGQAGLSEADHHFRFCRGCCAKLRVAACRSPGRTMKSPFGPTSRSKRSKTGPPSIPAKLAADAVRKLPAGAVSMTAADGEVEITGNGPRFRLRELSVADFPTIDDTLPAETVDVVGETLVKALSQVGIGASGDEARPTLTGCSLRRERRRASAGCHRFVSARGA